MATLESRRWEGVLAGLTRRDRRPCDYEVYLPDLLAGRNFTLDGDVAADVSEAGAALVRLNTSGSALAGAEALARLLLRAESVASSRIEGLVIGGRRLLRADAARQMGEDPGDVTAAEVLGNIDAMVWGVEAVEPGGQITARDLAGSSPSPVGRDEPRGTWRPHPKRPELDRRQQLQPLFGCICAAAAGGCRRSDARPVRLLQ